MNLTIGQIPPIGQISPQVLVNPMDPNSDLCPTKPLEYWKSNQCRFPVLSEIGRDVVNWRNVYMDQFLKNFNIHYNWFCNVSAAALHLR